MLAVNSVLTRALGLVPVAIALVLIADEIGPDDYGPVRPVHVLAAYVVAIGFGEVATGTLLWAREHATAWPLASNQVDFREFFTRLVAGFVILTALALLEPLVGLPQGTTVFAALIGFLSLTGPGLGLLLAVGIGSTVSAAITDGSGSAWPTVAVLAAAAALASRSQQVPPALWSQLTPPGDSSNSQRELPRPRTMAVGLGTATVALVVAVVVTPLLGQPEGGSGFGTQTAAAEGWGIDDRGDILARPERTDQIVMFVSSDAPDYWRASTLDTWDGRFWTSSADVVDVTQPDADGWAYFADGSEGEPLVELFEYELGGSSVVLTREGTYAAITEDRRRAISTRDDGTARLFRSSFDADEAFWIASHPPSPTPDQLRAAHLAQPAFPRLGDALRYLDVGALSPRIARLAAEITAGEVTAYDRALGLEDWFDANMRYRLDSPLPPDGTDPLEFLLFEDRTGYCEQMATAMVLMARSLGIPARLAAGWVTQEQRSDGYWVVRSENAHALAELYFPGVGWVNFDPTDGVLPSTAARKDVVSVGGLARPVLPLVAVVLAAIAVGWLVHRLRARANAPTAGPLPWIDRAAARLYRLGADREVEVRPDDTLRGYASRLRTEGWDDDRLDLVADRLSALAYGPAEPSPDAEAELDELLSALEAADSTDVVHAGR